jgi:hypothetical protein
MKKGIDRQGIYTFWRNYVSKLKKRKGGGVVSMLQAPVFLATSGVFGIFSGCVRCFLYFLVYVTCFLYFLVYVTCFLYFLVYVTCFLYFLATFVRRVLMHVRCFLYFLVHVTCLLYFLSYVACFPEARQVFSVFSCYVRCSHYSLVPWVFVITFITIKGMMDLEVLYL